MRKKWPFLLFLTGLLFFLSPSIQNVLYEHEQQKLLTAWSQPTTSYQSATTRDPQIDVVLEIEKIDLKMPILEGATQDNLKKSLTTVNPNQHPGQGNYTVAGHRSFTYGKHFNRLNELIIGDIVLLKTNEQTYRFIVTEKFLVEPTNLSVLETNDDNPEITLITCDPAKNPTHRLIVKGHLERKK